MRRYNALYYLLFILLIMGAFAAMAQNSYGLKIMGGVAFAFAFLFLWQLIEVARSKIKADRLVLIELTGLFFLSAIFGLRIFYIRFPFVEIIFAVAGITLVLYYLRKMLSRYQQSKTINSWLANMMLVFHFSIMLFLISLALVPFISRISEWAGIAAFVFLIIFIAGGFIRKQSWVDGRKISAFGMITTYKDHSLIIVSICLLFSLFVGLNRIGLMPSIYSNQFPQAYFKLVNDATTGKEKPVNGKYKYEEFREKYDLFLKSRNKR